MFKVRDNYILRKFKNEYYVINIDDGDVLKIHEIGFKALEKLDECGTFEDVSKEICGPDDHPEIVNRLMKPFWDEVIKRNIVEKEKC